MSTTTPGTVKHVTSTQNPLVKSARALTQRKARAETGLFLAEGRKLVLDALEADWPPRIVFATEGEGVADLTARARTRGADIVFVNQMVMEKLARRDNPQTVLGVFEQRTVALGSLAGGTLVALEAPRDPGNLGTIVRTAEAMGASGLVLIGAATDPFGVEAVRASMGSVFHLPIAWSDIEALAAHAAAIGADVIATHLRSSEDISAHRPREPQILLMGTEQAGLTEAANAIATRCVRLAMCGKADSYNLAIATALALYELRRPFMPGPA